MMSQNGRAQIRNVGLVLTLLFVVACNSSNPEVVGVLPPNPEKPEHPDVVIPPRPQLPEFPKVAIPEPPAQQEPNGLHVQRANLHGSKPVPMDILFVVDTSQSMCAKQGKMRDNVMSFVKGFLKNRKIDFHIGVTATWDSKLYPAGGDGRVFKNGELRPVRSGGRILKDQNGQALRFVTPDTPNLQRTLAETLYIGFEPFDKSSPTTSGPEKEEIFSPIMSAFSQPNISGANQGFRRAGAHLAVVIFTDTDDLSPDSRGGYLEPQALSQSLQSLVDRGSSVTVLAALSRYSEMVNFATGSDKETFAMSFNRGRGNPKGSIGSCNPQDRNWPYNVDPELEGPMKGPARIAELVRLTSGKAFDLKSPDYGRGMSDLGKTLIRRSIQYEIILDHVPDLARNVEGSDFPIQVKINGKVIPPDDGKGWTYDSAPSRRTIQLNEGLELGDQDDFDVEVRYHPL